MDRVQSLKERIAADLRVRGIRAPRSLVELLAENEIAAKRLARARKPLLLRELIGIGRVSKSSK